MSRSALVEQLEPRRHLSAMKIMPLGDSITEGYVGNNPGYRFWLWNALKANNYEVDFVGSKHGVLNGTPGRTDYDQDHEGHSGWRADEILANIGTWAPLYHPDVVLMHLGTNDLNQGQSVASTITDLGSIIDTLRQSNPNITVFMAQIIPIAALPTQTQQLNAQIVTLAGQKNTATSRVILVDQWTGFSTSTDEADGIHPNESGDLKMGSAWFGAIRGALPALSTPPSSSVYLSSYNWSSAANAWGPVESNRSNGEQGLGDGNTLTLNGTTFAHGLGVHAGSDITYPLRSEFNEFRARVGVDDEAGANGSVVFRVYVDNTLMYDSGTMTGSSAAKLVSVSLAGRRFLRLQVTDGGDGNTWDHADWADATLFRLPLTGGVAPRLPVGNLSGTLFPSPGRTVKKSIDNDPLDDLIAPR